MARSITLLAAILVAASGQAFAQGSSTPPPEALRNAPPEIDRSRPGTDRSGGGPVGNDVTEDNQGGGPPRGVIAPPMAVDPGIHAPVPDAHPNTTPVIPPPGAPGGDRSVVPR